MSLKGVFFVLHLGLILVPAGILVMKLEDITKVLDLEERHYRSKRLKVPVIDSMLYTSLGKQLFDLYEKYKVERADQRKLESLGFLLTSFTLERDSKSGFFSKSSKEGR